ncbi:SulP family inorganic anion transporter [Mameliella alba]|uniref:SulP family inorganic anion transporter n=1 Tax=Mameliella alba TaxID=561184 RepID=UPI001C977D45|nr:SulP family inorganic anion transporter [Mameliella alba]MBY6122313.1 SulP family inorganic anion transporter [Mameliella alba]
MTTTRKWIAALAPDWRHKVSPSSVRSDVIAGLTGATLVLPQGVAFAAIAGLPPETGFYTAMVPTVIAALVGSSWQAVSGPATAISVLVFGALSGSFEPGSPEFVSAAIALAFMVGILQLIMGLARLGEAVEFVSHSVMTGFVTGAAILIAFSQAKHVLGVDLPKTASVADLATELFRAIPQADPRSAVIATVAIMTAVVIRHFRASWPNYLIALCASTVASILLGGADAGIATVGAIDSVIPQLAAPALSFGFIRDFGGSAAAIAIVGLLEAISVARAMALRSGQLVDANREFLGQGASNVVGGLFQCYPSTVSFTRSGVNLDSGAVTPMSAIFSACFLFLILLLVAPLFAYVPVPGMAGVILLVAWRLIDMREIRHIVAGSSSETAIALVTFVVAMLVDLDMAIFAGVLLSLALFLRGTSRPFLGVGAPDPSTPGRTFRLAASHHLAECPQLMVTRLEGSLYFGSVEYLRRQFRRFEVDRPQQKHMIFILKGVGEVDLPGADLILEEAARRTSRDGTFHLQIKAPRTIAKLARMKVLSVLGRDRIHLSKHDAIAKVVPALDPSVCAGCRARIFRECASMPGHPPSGLDDCASRSRSAEIGSGARDAGRDAV